MRGDCKKQEVSKFTLADILEMQPTYVYGDGQERITLTEALRQQVVDELRAYEYLVHRLIMERDQKLEAETKEKPPIGELE